MSKRKTASRLTCWINRYLTHRCALGHRNDGENVVLKALLRHVKQCDCRDLNTRGFENWLAGIKNLHPNTRRKYYQMARLFCLYRRRSEPRCFVPSADGAAKPQPYVTPVIVEPDQIARMLALASKLPRTVNSPLRPEAMRLAVALLYTCGLRLGELLRLTMGDVEENDTVLRIRESKFHKSRLVPLSQTATGELRSYLLQRRKKFAVHPHTPLLCTRHCAPLRPYSAPGFHCAFRLLFKAAAVCDDQGKLPRIHDLRHTFAVQALIRWYKEGADVQSNLPKLALYMGHVSIESSAYYLHWVPALRSLASQRFEEKFGQLVEGGAL
jgi:integrase/recombinase XerD